MIQAWSVGIYAQQCGMSTCHVFVIDSNDARTLGHLRGKWQCSYPCDSLF
jgi:hypothetical protein